LTDVAAHVLPGGRPVLAALLQVRAAGVGEGEQLAPVGLFRADQPLVLELLKRRIDRAGARAPQALAALLDLLHDLVAVARLLGEQQQGSCARVAAASLAAAPAGAATPAAER